MAWNINTPHRVMAKGYKFGGSFKSGYRATVPFLVLWENAFLFMDEVMYKTHAGAAGPFTTNLPLRFPTGAVMFASDVDIEPCGADGSLAIPNEGVRPGEFYTHAMIKVQFETPDFTWSAIDDPNGLHQLDPNNPISACEQSVKINAKMETRKGSKWKYDSDSVVVKTDFTQLVIETHLVLTFPRIPFMPWQRIRPYIGTINTSAVLDCAAETVLLLGMNTVTKKSTGGGDAGNITQQVQLECAYQPTSWNKIERPSGLLEQIHKAFGTIGTDTLYQKSNFLDIFTGLAFSATN